MSFSVPGGFTGGDALLAFAAIQQGRWNEQMSDAMTMADLRSQMAQDINDIKAHLEIANRHPEKFGELNAELQAFMEKYGDVPELEQATSVVGEIASNVRGRMEERFVATHHVPSTAQYTATGRNNLPIGTYSQHLSASSGNPYAGTPIKYADETIRTWLDQLTGTLDTVGTSDDLNMIHIKQLNDRINNSSGMVSGIIESRANSTASIINNIA
jgi:hypothetical protein